MISEDEPLDKDTSDDMILANNKCRETLQGHFLTILLIV